MIDFMEVLDFLCRLLLVYIGWGAGITYINRKGIRLWHQLKDPPKYSLLVYFLQAIFLSPGVDWVNILYYRRWAERIEKEKNDRIHPSE